MTDARWLSAGDAARYLGMETEGFRRAVRKGILPAASYKLGPQTPRWDRTALDRAMGADDVNGMEEILSAMVEAEKRENQDGSSAVRKQP